MYIIVGIIAFICFACLYEYISGKAKRSVIGIVICAILGISMVIAFFAITLNSGSSSNLSKHNTCQVCGRTFDNASSNAKSIRKTSMCNQCYKNYNAAQNMLDN